MIYSAKCYFCFTQQFNEKGEVGYEQRIVLLDAKNEDEAIDLAENEAARYAKKHKAVFLDFIEVFKLFENNIDLDMISEVYSLTMYDHPDQEEFLNNYYLTGGNSR